MKSGPLAILFVLLFSMFYVKSAESYQLFFYKGDDISMSFSPLRSKFRYNLYNNLGLVSEVLVSYMPSFANASWTLGLERDMSKKLSMIVGYRLIYLQDYGTFVEESKFEHGMFMGVTYTF